MRPSRRSLYCMTAAETVVGSIPIRVNKLFPYFCPSDNTKRGVKFRHSKAGMRRRVPSPFVYPVYEVYLIYNATYSVKQMFLISKININKYLLHSILCTEVN